MPLRIACEGEAEVFAFRSFCRTSRTKLSSMSSEQGTLEKHTDLLGTA